MSGTVTPTPEAERGPTPPPSPAERCASDTRSPPPESDAELFPTLPDEGSRDGKRLSVSFETLRKLNVAKHNHDALCRAVHEEKELIHFVHSLRERIQASSPQWNQFEALCMVEDATAALQRDYDSRIAAAEGRRRDVLGGARNTDRMTRPESYDAVVGAADRLTLAELEDELKQARERCLKWMKEKLELEKKQTTLESSIASMESLRQQLEAKELTASQKPKLQANVEQLASSVDTLVKLLSIPVAGKQRK